MTIIISCEHGGNKIPQKWKKLFLNSGNILNTHRGYDPGALELAKLFSRKLKAPLTYSVTTRLLVELNRSLHHRNLFSKFSKILSDNDKEIILKTYYFPYRHKVEQSIEKLIKENKLVIHLSVHTFTPYLMEERKTEIGLLYDPSFKREKEFCAQWKDEIIQSKLDLRVRYNYPYRGTFDAFTTHLRKKWKHKKYIGLELEVNQKLVETKEWGKIMHMLVDTFEKVFLLQIS